ncbi:MAG: cupin domain-containing protein [Bacteroidales bacterium]
MKNNIEYNDHSVVSKQLIKKRNGSITLFAFDQGEGLSEHSTPFDAFVQILDGEALITIDKKDHTLKAGEYIIMPANIPHKLHAPKRFKMLLCMIKA